MEQTARVRTRERFLQVALLGVGLSLLSGATLVTTRQAEHAPLSVGDAALVLVPLAPLLWGLALLERRREAATTSLLLLVPCSLVAALFVSSTRLDPIVFCVRAVTLVAYLVQAARLVEEPREDEVLPVVQSGPLLGARARLVRRARIYTAFTGLAVVAFAWPLYRALGAAGPLLPTFAAAGLLGVLACRAFLVDPLDRHLQRDPALEDTLARLRRHARHGRPARSFYLVALVALAAMMALVLRAKMGWT